MCECVTVYVKCKYPHIARGTSLYHLHPYNYLKLLLIGGRFIHQHFTMAAAEMSISRPRSKRTTLASTPALLLSESNYGSILSAAYQRFRDTNRDKIRSLTTREREDLAAVLDKVSTELIAHFESLIKSHATTSTQDATAQALQVFQSALDTIHKRDERFISALPDVPETHSITDEQLGSLPTLSPTELEQLRTRDLISDLLVQIDGLPIPPSRQLEFKRILLSLPVTDAVTYRTLRTDDAKRAFFRSKYDTLSKCLYALYGSPPSGNPHPRDVYTEKQRNFCRVFLDQYISKTASVTQQVVPLKGSSRQRAAKSKRVKHRRPRNTRRRTRGCFALK